MSVLEREEREGYGWPCEVGERQPRSCGLGEREGRGMWEAGGEAGMGIAQNLAEREGYGGGKGIDTGIRL